MSINPHLQPPPGIAKDAPSWELLSTCVHCGLCLNHCPTYKVLGVEMDSPRGRIYQVLQVNEGKMPLGDTLSSILTSAWAVWPVKLPALPA